MGVAAWLRRLLPAPLTHIPSAADLARDEDLAAKAIVKQHAEGSVLLGEGKFEIGRDLFEEDEEEAGAQGRDR